MATAVYPVRFKRPLQHARDYLGFVEDAQRVMDRLHRHIDETARR